MADKKFDNMLGEPVVTPAGTCSFPHLKSPDVGRQFSDGKYKFDLIFDKDETDFSDMQKVCDDLAQKKWGVPLSEIDMHPFKNGDEKEGKTQGYANSVFITPKSGYPVACYGPTKVDGKIVPIEPEKIYAGCKMRAYVVPLTFESKKERGITFRLIYAQFLEDGPRFGGFGAVDASDVFSEHEKGSANKVETKAASTSQVSNGEDVSERASAPKSVVASSKKKEKASGKSILEMI